MKAGNKGDPELASKIQNKIPLFEKAIAKLKEKKKTFKFASPSTDRGSTPKDEFTLGMHSTMNEYSHFTEGPNQTKIEEPSFKNYADVQDSFANSVKTLFDSIKTDNFSKYSDQSIFQNMNQSKLVNNEEFIGEKLKELERKLDALKEAST